MKKILESEIIINVKKTWRYARDHRKYLILYIVFSVVLSIVSAITPIISALMLLRLTEGNLEALMFYAGLILFIGIISGFFRYFSGKSVQIFFRETLLQLQVDLAKETVFLETEVIDKNSSGVFVDRLNKDSYKVASVFDDFSFYVTELLTNVGIFIAIFIVSKEMFFFFVITLIILFFIEKIKLEKYIIRDKKYREISEKNTGLISELIRGIKDIKILNIYQNFIDKVYKKFKKSNQERYQMTQIARRYDLLSRTLKETFIFLFLAFGIWLIQNELLTIAGLVILIMYQNRVYNLLRIIGFLLETIKDFNLSSKRVFEIIDNQKYRKETFGTKKIKKLAGHIQFDKVSFAYDNEITIINNLSFKIKPNETIAFVGKSGSGKSTIFSLLTKLYKIKEGEILIDNVNIDELDRNTLRQNISIITQTPYIFNFSIKENLKIVKENLSDKKMIEFCKLACIHDFIMTLPDKYDTVVGEGGLTLSGGQRQRLAIARALIKESEVILFDEATSALDNETQKKVQQAILNLKNKNTILIIAHRLSTIINCDRILLIDNGEIVAEGSHRQLLKKSPIYQNLYKTEFSNNDPEKIL